MVDTNKSKNFVKKQLEKLGSEQEDLKWLFWLICCAASSQQKENDGIKEFIDAKNLHFSDYKLSSFDQKIERTKKDSLGNRRSIFITPERDVHRTNLHKFIYETSRFSEEEFKKNVQLSGHGGKFIWSNLINSTNGIGFVAVQVLFCVSAMLREKGGLKEHIINFLKENNGKHLHWTQDVPEITQIVNKYLLDDKVLEEISEEKQPAGQKEVKNEIRKIPQETHELVKTSFREVEEKQDQNYNHLRNATDKLIGLAQENRDGILSLENRVTSHHNDNSIEDNKTKNSLLNSLLKQPPYSGKPKTSEQSQGGKIGKSSHEVSLNPLNHFDITFQGRKEEKEKLDAFIDATEPFQMLYIIAPSGAGKTRLITEWYRDNLKIIDWVSGFVEHIDSNEGLKGWEKWEKEKIEHNTLIIVDYIYRFKDVIRYITDKWGQYARDNVTNNTNIKKLRLIMLDHTMPESNKYKDMDKHKRQSISKVNMEETNYFHHHSPILLGKANPKDHEAMIKNIIGEVSKFKASSRQVDIAYRALQQMDKQDNNETDVKFANYPLFAILIGKKLSTLSNDKDIQNLTNWERRDLINFYFDEDSQKKGELRRIPWINNEFGIWVGASISAATVLRTLSYDSISGVLYQYNTPSALGKIGIKDFPPENDSEEEIFKSTCNHIVSSMDKKILVRYQPDILGETFALRFITYYKRDFENNDGIAVPTFEMLCSQMKQDKKKKKLPIIHKGLVEFAIRASRNLCYDDPENEDVEKSWDSLSLLLSPKNYAASPSMRLSVSIALTNIINLVREEFEDKLETLDEQLKSLGNLVEIDVLLRAYKGYSKDGRRQYNDIWKHCLGSITTYMDWLLLKPNQPKGLSKKLELFLSTYESTNKSGFTRIFLPSIFHAPKLLEYIAKQNPNIDINKRYDAGTTPFLSACIYGTTSFVSWALDKNIKLELTLNKDFTALMIASRHGHQTVVSQLRTIDGIDVNETNSSKATALMVACKNGHHTVVTELLKDKKIDVNMQDDKGWTALMVASDSGKYKVVEELLNVDDIDPNLQTKKNETALMFACRKGHYEVVTKLIKHKERKTDVNIQSDNGGTALIFASEQGHHAIVEKLLSVNDIDPDRKSKKHHSALMLASQNSHHETVKKLINHKTIDVNAKDDQEWTALMIASHNGHNIVVNHLLGAKNIDVNCEDKSGYTAYLISLDRKEKIIQKLFLESPLFSGINSRVNDETPLMHACKDNDIDLVEAALSHPKIDLNKERRGDRWTALMIACDLNNVDIVKILLDSEKLDVNVQNKQGRTALMIVCEKKNIPLIEKILSVENVDITLKDTSNNDAFTLSEGAHCDEIHRLLANKNKSNFIENILSFSFLKKEEDVAKEE